VKSLQNDNNDPYHLQRFVRAQEGMFERALQELRQGDKRSHWIWFIFPQMRGLGSSRNAQYYALSSREEAAAYLNHPTLGLRLRACAEEILQVEGRSLREILGTPDDLKFCSSMTLFAQATDDNRLFLDALAKYCGSELDAATLQRL
jgi:uncharacterized protein (DUF1810 family)